MKKHNETAAFECNICKKKFVNDRKLKRHIESHNPNRRFECHLCDKSFKAKSDLSQHLSIHLCEKNFICYCCERVFLRKYHLKRHLEAKTPCDWKFNFKTKLSLQKIHQFETDILLDPLI